MSEYPERQQYFALHFIRWLSDSGAVMEIGPDAFAMLTAVVSMEDELRYSRAPNFYNEQLARRCGIVSVHSLIRARNKCTEAGLLHYEAAKKRSPGTYYVCGFTAQNAGKDKGQLRLPCAKRTESGRKTQPSIPMPNPNPKSKGASLFSGVSFEDFWNAYPLRNGKRVGKPDAIKAFSKINEADHVDLMRAVKGYAASGQMAKDASRFLKDNYWRDWIDSPTNSTESDSPAPQAKRRRRTI